MTETTQAQTNLINLTQFPATGDDDLPYVGRHVRFDFSRANGRNGTKPHFVLSARYDLTGEYEGKQVTVVRHLTEDQADPATGELKQGGLAYVRDMLQRHYDYEGPIGRELAILGSREFVGREVPLYNQHNTWNGRVTDKFGWSRQTLTLPADDIPEDIGSPTATSTGKPKARKVK